MCNCGKRRTEHLQQSHTATGNTKMANHVQTPAFTSFEYFGKTALSVTGKVTGTPYRFNAPGNRQNVDSRDAAGLQSIPVLRKLR